MTLSRQLKWYASDDINEILKTANSQLGTHMRVNSIKLDKPDIIIDEDEDADELVVTATANISEGNKSFNFSWDYMVDGDYIYLQSDNDELSQDLIDRYNERCNVNASSVSRKRPIMAADDDFDELTDDQVEDDTFEDSIDDLSDKVDHLQDSVDDVNEDDPKIETDNNISNHYIAECDNCHGIFISAVVESDQEVKAITGTCPLCEKDSEQLLKWVIKDVEDGQ